MPRTFKADLNELLPLLEYVRNESKNLGLSPSLMNSIELATEEVVVNIINYGYSSRKGTIEVSCTSPYRGGLKIVIKDHGKPFNPLENAPKYDPDTPLQEKEVGGCGIFFITKIMDEVQYSRENESNILTLVKHHIH
jgi:serine/threonine-protein kinase RsbW